MIERWQVQDDPRQAGCIKRYHTWPTIQSQTVAEHTWQIFRIFCQIFGPPMPIMFQHILWHDVGEMHIGDVPFSAKAKSKVFHAEVNRLEEEARNKLIGHGLPELTPKECRRLKICDLLEMWEFGHTELLFGNQMAHPVTVDTIRALNKLLTEEAPEEVVFVNQYMDRRKEFFKCT